MKRKEIKRRLFLSRKRRNIIKKNKRHSSRRSELIKNTMNRREYRILYSQLIHWKDCWICSKRYGRWISCRRQFNNKEWDNPVKSWKYLSKRKTQWKV